MSHTKTNFLVKEINSSNREWQLNEVLSIFLSAPHPIHCFGKHLGIAAAHVLKFLLKK